VQRARVARAADRNRSATARGSRCALALARAARSISVEAVPLPVPVLRDLKKLAAEVVREESEKSPMARKVHASFTKFQALVGPWDRVAEGAYHQFVAV